MLDMHAILSPQFTTRLKALCMYTVCCCMYWIVSRHTCPKCISVMYWRMCVFMQSQPKHPKGKSFVPIKILQEWRKESFWGFGTGQWVCVFCLICCWTVQQWLNNMGDVFQPFVFLSPFFIRLMDSCTVRQLFPCLDYAPWPLFYLEACVTSNEVHCLCRRSTRTGNRRPHKDLPYSLTRHISLSTGLVLTTPESATQTNSGCQRTHMWPKMSKP